MFDSNLAASLAEVKFKRLNTYLASLPTTELSKTDKEWLEKSVEIARGSLHPKNKVGATIYNRSRIVSIGVNSSKTNPFQAKWNKHSDCLHAEIAALLYAMRYTDADLTGCSVAVARVAKSHPRCSYPCKSCWPALYHLGIRHVVCYDTNDMPVSIRL